MQKKKGIREERLEITDFNFDVINEFLDDHSLTVTIFLYVVFIVLVIMMS